MFRVRSMINLTTKGAGSTLDGQQQKYLLRKVNKLAQAKLTTLLDEVLTLSSEALIEAAKGVEPDLQRLYFDALCRLYGKRAPLLEEFADHFATHYYASVNRCLALPGEPMLAPAELEGMEEEQLADLSTKLERDTAEHQMHLCRQLEIVLGRDISSEDHPLGVQQVLRVFQHVLFELDAPPQVNIIYNRIMMAKFESDLVTTFQEIITYLDEELVESQPAEGSAVAKLIEHLQRRLSEKDAKIVEERVEAAMAQVNVAVVRLVDGSVLPEPLATLLVEPWKTLMAAILIEEGEQSIRWLVCLEVTKELIVSVQPIESSVQRQALVKMLPRLVQLLRINLQEITWLKLDCQRLFSQLEQLHLSQLSRSSDIV